MAYVITKRRPVRRVRRHPVRRGILGGLGDLLLGASASTNPAASGLVCSADGMFKLVNGAWQRLAPGEVCGSLSTMQPGSNTSGAGVSVTDAVACAAPAATGIATTPDPSLYNGATLTLAATEGDPIDYKVFCKDPSQVGLSRDQRTMVIAAFIQPWTPVHRGLLDSITGNDHPDLSAYIAAYKGQKVWKDAVTGQVALWTFKTPDGDTKNVFATVSGDPADPTITFTWKHEQTAWQMIDNFVTSISPFDPAPLLCQMLPMATKIPNAYVAAGSIVLQLSGKCPQSCPPGMQFDATAKTCSCPPGLVPNPQTLTCDQPKTGFAKYLPYAIAGGAVLAAFAILSGPKKKAHHP